MKTVILTEAGGIENLVLQDIVEPKPARGEVLVQVKALSINPVDVKTRSGKALYGKLKEENQIILGWDISGVVVATGEGTSKFKEGDEVFGMVNFPGHGRAYAELVLSPEDHLTLKPTTISHAEAAASTLAALTAWQVLLHLAQIQKGQRVFIQAAAGGVGHFAVRIAKHFGCYVIGSASGANADFLKGLELDEHIDYTQEKFEEVVAPVDLFFDSLGAESVVRGLKITKPGGKIFSIVGGCNEENLKVANEKSVQAENYLVHSSGADMTELATLLEKGILKAHVSQTFSLEEIGEAHKQIESGKTRGKVIINL